MTYKPLSKCIENYYKFCEYFDMAAEQKIEFATLKQKAIELEIDFDSFCDANEFPRANTWEEAVEAYKQQIEDGERVLV